MPLRRKSEYFAYIRELPRKRKRLTGRSTRGKEALKALISAVKEKVKFVPRFEQHECCKLTAMIIRDVLGAVAELTAASESESYNRSFQGSE